VTSHDKAGPLLPPPSPGPGLARHIGGRTSPTSGRILIPMNPCLAQGCDEHVFESPHRLEPPRCPEQQGSDESVATQEPQGAQRRAERRRAAHTTRGPGEVAGSALSCRGRASPERAWPHGCSRAAQPRAGQPAARSVSARPVSALPIIAAASRHGGRAWSFTATGRSVGANSFGDRHNDVRHGSRRRPRARPATMTTNDGADTRSTLEEAC
jgi:hypothetical protein